MLFLVGVHGHMRYTGFHDRFSQSKSDCCAALLSSIVTRDSAANPRHAEQSYLGESRSFHIFYERNENGPGILGMPGPL